MEKHLLEKWLSLESCRLAPIALVLAFLSISVLATEDRSYNKSNLSLAQAPPTTADNLVYALESRIERILSQVDVIARSQDRLSKQIEDVCQQTHGRDAQATKRSLSSGQVEQPIVEKDVFKFNRLASNLIPSSTISGQNYRQNQATPDALIHQDHPSEGGPVSRDNVASSSLDWATVKEQLASIRLGLNKLMSRVLEQSYQYETIWSQLALIKDECSLAYQSTLPNGLATQVADSGFGGMPISASDSTNSGSNMQSQQQHQDGSQRCQSGGLRSSDISTLVRLLSQELSNVCAASGRHLHEVGQPKVDAWLARQLAEISSVTKQSAQLLSRLAATLEQRPISTLVLEPVDETQAFVGGASTSGPTAALPTNASTQTVKPGGRASSRWQPGSKVPQNCRSSTSTSLEVPRGCQELRRAGATCSGKYLVYVMDEWRQLYCDMYEREPWTVVMRRIDKSRFQDHSTLEQNEAASVLASESHGSNSLQFLTRLRAQQESFSVDWTNYELGFGATDEWAEFFGGLSLMHKLTSGSGAGAELQVELEWSQGRRLRLYCGYFSVANASLHYRASVANCSSVGQDSEALVQAVLSMNGAPFQVGGSPERLWGWWRRESSIQAGAQQPPEPTAPLPLVWPHDSTEPLHRLQFKVRARQ